MAILRDCESQLINIHKCPVPFQISALCWVLIRFIATIIRFRVRVRVRVRVSDIRVKIFRVKAGPNLGLEF